MLSLRQVEDVCLLDCGFEQCRYIDSYVNDQNKFFCRKLIKKDKQIIDDLIAEHNIQDLIELDEPIGNNCPGYVKTDYFIQGYDVKKVTI